MLLIFTQCYSILGEDMPTYGKDTAFFWVTILKRIFMVTLFLTNQTSRMFEQNHKLYPDLFRKDTRERVLSYIIREKQNPFWNVKQK